MTAASSAPPVPSVASLPRSSKRNFTLKQFGTSRWKQSCNDINRMHSVSISLPRWSERLAASGWGVNLRSARDPGAARTLRAQVSNPHFFNMLSYLHWLVNCGKKKDKKQENPIYLTLDIAQYWCWRPYCCGSLVEWIFFVSSVFKVFKWHWWPISRSPLEVATLTHTHTHTTNTHKLTHTHTQVYSM